jgi:hypothetical protein
MIQNVLLHLCRYAAATIVAFVASLGVIAVWRSIDPSVYTLTFLSKFTAAIFLLLVGFCGVFSGAWCLSRATRWRGAMVLVAFGFAFGAYLASLLPWQDQESVDPAGYLILLPIPFGGACAVYLLRYISLTRHWSEPTRRIE